MEPKQWWSVSGDGGDPFCRRATWMQYRVPLLIFAVTALAVLLISGLPGQAPTQVTSALPPAIQRTPPPPADVLPSVPTRPVFK